MGVAFFTTEVDDRIKEVVKYAEDHRIDFAEMVRSGMEGRVPIGEDPKRVVQIPVAVRVVFSIESQPKLGWYRHISISTMRNTIHPNVAFIILEKFGFENRKEKGETPSYTDVDRAWKEEFLPGRFAINFIQRMK